MFYPEKGTKLNRQEATLLMVCWTWGKVWKDVCMKPAEMPKSPLGAGQSKSHDQVWPPQHICPGPRRLLSALSDFALDSCSTLHQRDCKLLDTFATPPDSHP